MIRCRKNDWTVSIFLCSRSLEEWFAHIRKSCVQVLINWSNQIRLVCSRRTNKTYVLLKPLCRISRDINWNHKNRRILKREEVGVCEGENQYEHFTSKRIKNRWFNVIFTIIREITFYWYNYNLCQWFYSFDTQIHHGFLRLSLIGWT